MNDLLLIETLLEHEELMHECNMINFIVNEGAKMDAFKKVFKDMIEFIKRKCREINDNIIKKLNIEVNSHYVVSKISNDVSKTTVTVRMCINFLKDWLNHDKQREFDDKLKTLNEEIERLSSIERLEKPVKTKPSEISNLIMNIKTLTESVEDSLKYLDGDDVLLTSKAMSRTFSTLLKKLSTILSTVINDIMKDHSRVVNKDK